MIWRGGRRFAPLKKPSPKADKKKPGANGGGDDAIMIIDSDEEEREGEEEEQATYEFEADEAEIDPSCPYEDVLRQIDIPLGSSVLDLAVPKRILPLEQWARSSADSFPPILNDMMVIAAVCADFSTRIVALPLDPPHPEQTHPSAWKIQTISITDVLSHQEIPRGVSMTFTLRQSGDEDALGKGHWDLLLATHSAEASGLLLVYRIPILEKVGEGATTYALSQNDVEPVQRYYLPSPAKSISFNPSPYPSARHSTLLVSFHSGFVKIYSCFSSRQSKTARRTSGPRSAANAEGTDMEGKWLITMYPGFEHSPSGIVRRKTIVDAEWVLGGQAVIVLLADGSWGVWDVEGAGPGSIKGPLERQSSIEGVTGSSLTAFSVSGRILGSFSMGNDGDAKFAPMTPSTKRIREDSLLKGSSSLGGSASNLRGEISVFQTNSLREPSSDESILFRHGEQCAGIPSLLSLWRNAIKSAGTLDASNRCRVTVIPDVNVLGEQSKGIGHLPAATRHGRKETGRQAFDILVTGEHRLIILAPRLSESDATARHGPAAYLAPAETIADQLQLRRGELDVDGMGRVLSGMANVNRLQSPVKRVRLFS